MADNHSDNEEEEVTSLMAKRANFTENCMDIDGYIEDDVFKRVPPPPIDEDEGKVETIEEPTSGYEADVSKVFNSNSVDKSVQIINYGLLSHTDRGSSGILVDSGCTDHMFNQRKFFNSFTVCNGNVNIGEKGRSIKIEGKGSIKLIGNNNKLIQLDPVYLVPELLYNLLSLSSMWNHGIQIVNHGKIFQMKKKDKVIFDGVVKSKLLHANLRPAEKSAYSSIIHRRSGHKLTDEQCESCKFGRMTRNKFSKSRDRTLKCGEEYSIDLAGPFSPVSLGGSKYFINLVDTASNFTWVKPIKHKNDTAEEIMFLFKRWDRMGILKNLKRIITDGGGEFIGEEFQDVLRDFGLTHIITTPHTPQNNGIVERMNRTLMERVRTIMLEASLPKFLWAEVLSTVSYLHNVIETERGCPLEMFMKEVPNTKKLRTIGCLVYYNISHHGKIGKLEFRSKKGIMIGYDQLSTCYRIYDPEGKKIIRTRDVKFHESVFPLKKIIHEDVWETPILPVEDKATEEVKERETENNSPPAIEKVSKTVAPVRRSERIKNLEDKYGKWRANCAYITEIEEIVEEEQSAIAFQASFEMENRVVPNSYKEAMNLPDKQKWKSAIFEELDSLENNQVFDIISRSDLEKRKTLVGSRWVLTQKFNELGE
jgi:hypothetical protein